MHNVFILLLLNLITVIATAQTAIANPDYDSGLAEQLGSDDYGMKSYFLVILKTGNNTSTDKDFIQNAFRGHMDNINKLVDEGKLIVAGPLGKNDADYRGIFILNVSTLEDAKEALTTDIAIKEQLLAVDIYPWYGSAALPQYLQYANKIWKQKP